MEVLSIVLLNGFMFYKLYLIYCVKGSKKLLFFYSPKTLKCLENVLKDFITRISPGQQESQRRKYPEG